MGGHVGMNSAAALPTAGGQRSLLALGGTAVEPFVAGLGRRFKQAQVQAR